MPMKAMFEAGMSNPNVVLSNVPKKKPAMAPANNAGAKSPATPPPEFDEHAATGLNTSMAAVIAINIHGFAPRLAKSPASVNML